MNVPRKLNVSITREKLEEIQRKLDLEAVVVVDEWQMPKLQAGDPDTVRDLLQSNAIQCLHSQVPVSLTLGSDTFEVLLLTEDGIVAQNPRDNRIVMGLVMRDEYLLLLSPATDPGFLQFEIRHLLAENEAP